MPRTTAAELVDQMTPDQTRAALHRVVHLCNSYTPEPPPIFRGPGLSERGEGYNAGTRDIAGAVLSMVRGEQSESDE